jgi:hypothetical protein
MIKIFPNSQHKILTKTVKTTSTATMDYKPDTTTESLYFNPILITYSDTQEHLIVSKIPRFYVNQSFSTRRKAITFFKTHNTSVTVPLTWDHYLSFKSRCVNRTLKRSTLSNTCNFNTQDYETAQRHLTTGHPLDTLLNNAPVTFRELPTLQDDAKRHAFREHLFGNRLATLCKHSRVPVFNKTTHLTERMYYFNERKFTIIYSRDDSFTDEYIRTLRALEIRAQAFIDISLIKDSQFADVMALFLQLTNGLPVTIAKIVLGAIAGFTGIVSNVIILCSNPTRRIANCAIISIFAQIAPNIIDKIGNFLNGWVQPQSAFTWIPSAVSLLLLTILGATNLTAAGGITICQKAARLGMTLASIGAFHRIFSEAWREMYPYIHEKLYGTAPGFDECFSQLDNFKSLVDRVDRFREQERHKHIMTSRPVCEEVHAMHNDLNKLFEMADRLRMRQVLTPVVRSYQKDITEWRAKALTSAFKVSGTRIEPVVLHIHGPSGVGKSRLTPCLVLEVLKDELDFDTFPELSNHIYTRNAASEFWAGYTGQMAVVFDDFMQKRDSEGSPNPEVFEVIQSANNSPFLVPMADLSEKANSYFTSKFMILSSNVDTLSPKSITHPAALQRRMDVVVKVTRPRPVNNTNGVFDTSCYDFALYIDEEPTVTLNFQQLVTLLREKRKLKNSSCDVMLQDIAFRKETPVMNEDLSHIPNIHRIVGQPSNMKNAEVPNTSTYTPPFEPTRLPPPIPVSTERVIAQGFYDWFANTKVPYQTESFLRHQEAIAPVLLGQAIPYSTIARLNLQKFFKSEEGEFAMIERTKQDAANRPMFAEIAAAMEEMSFAPDDDIDLFAYATAIKDTEEFKEIEQTAAALAVSGSLQKFFEASLLNSFKKLYPGNMFTKIFEKLPTGYTLTQVIVLAATGGGITALIGLLIYSMLKCFTPEKDIATPERYTTMYESVSDDLLTPYAYAELYDKDRDACQEHTRIAKESWDHMGKTPSMRGAVKGVRRESWDHMGRTPTMRGAVKGARVVRNGDIDPASAAIVNRITDQVATFYSAMDTVGQAGVGTFLVGRCCFLNLHVLESIQAATQCVVLLPGYQKRTAFEWNDLKVHKHPAIDLAMIVFPPQVRDHRNLVKHICTEADLNFQNTNVRIPLKRARNFEILNIKARTSNEALIVGSNPSIPEEDDDCFQVKGYIEYNNGFTIAGDCGSLVVLCNPRINQKICGMHVAGTSSAGFAFLLVLDHVEYLLDFARTDEKFEFVAPETADNPRPVIQGAVEQLGLMRAPFDPTSTSVRKSEIHGLFPVTKAPAILRPTNGVDPMIKGATNFGREPGFVSERDMESCRESMKAAFFVGTPVLARTLTIEEAVFGIPGVIEPMKTDTSPGYPWCLEKTVEPGKRHWIRTPNTQTGEKGFIHPDLRTALEPLIADARAGKISPSVFKDTLKDERRKLSRCNPADPDNIKTRVFAASPMHLVILLKMYYGAFFQHIQEQRIQNTTAIGVNPYGVEWHCIVKKLHEVNITANDGDYENFDTTQPPAFIDGFFTIAREWYDLHRADHNDDIVRQCAGRQVTFAIHLCKGEAYRVMGKNPSGTYGTTQINSGSNLCAFQYAWDKIFPTTPGPEHFHRNVRMITNGDDVVYSVTPKFSDFTITNISAHLKTINMNITPALKEGGFVEARPIEECTFLKRGFKRMEGFYRGPLDIDTCRDMTQWTKKSGDNIAATIENCKIAARELAITQPTGEVRQLLGGALAEIGQYTHLATTREILEEYRQFF